MKKAEKPNEIAGASEIDEKIRRRMADPVAVGKRLRKLRGCRTMRGVCRDVGASYSTLTKIEYGERRIGESLARKLADYYGVTEDEIFYAEE